MAKSAFRGKLKVLSQKILRGKYISGLRGE